METSIIKGITSVMLVELYSISIEEKRVLSDELIYFEAFCPVVMRREFCKKWNYSSLLLGY